MNTDALTPKAQRTRAALIAAAEGVIGRDGTGDLSVMSVCAAAGVGRTSFYTYFADVEALAAEVGANAAEGIRAAFDAAHLNEPRGVPRLGACLRMLIGIAERAPDQMLLLTALATRPGPVREILTGEIAAELAAAPHLSEEDHIALGRLIATGIIGATRDLAEGRITAEIAGRMVDRLIRACDAG